MGLMDSINVHYIWKAIQESERSDEDLYPTTTLSDRLFQAFHSERERGDGVEHMRRSAPVREKPDATSPSRSRLSDG